MWLSCGFLLVIDSNVVFWPQQKSESCSISFLLPLLLSLPTPPPNDLFSKGRERRIKGKTGSIIQWGSNNRMTGAVFLFTSEGICSLGGFNTPALNYIQYIPSCSQHTLSIHLMTKDDMTSQNPVQHTQTDASMSVPWWILIPRVSPEQPALSSQTLLSHFTAHRHSQNYLNLGALVEVQLGLVHSQYWQPWKTFGCIK